MMQNMMKTCGTADIKSSPDKMRGVREHGGNQEFSEAESAMTETKLSGATMVMCPMAKMCMGMMGKRPSGVLLMLPGILLIVVGVLIVVQPTILVWLIAAASILVGGMLLMMASFVRRMGAQLRM